MDDHDDMDGNNQHAKLKVQVQDSKLKFQDHIEINPCNFLYFLDLG